MIWNELLLSQTCIYINVLQEYVGKIDSNIHLYFTAIYSYSRAGISQHALGGRPKESVLNLKIFIDFCRVRTAGNSKI